MAKYVLILALLSGVSLAHAARWGGAHWVLLWPAASFSILAIGYMGLGPRVLGKRPDGRIAWWAWVIHAPYFTGNTIVWWLQCRLTREASCHQVAPGLWLGRRASPREIPQEVKLVVDLTAEFAERSAICRKHEYVCVPTLDATATDRSSQIDLLDRIAACDGDVYVHCAAGHGRSAALMAAVFLARGLADDPEKAHDMLRQVRPGVRINTSQMRALASLREWVRRPEALHERCASARSSE